MLMKRVERNFYGHGAKHVARNLLGCRLVSDIGGFRTSGIIVETEAYCDSDERDLACHGDKANHGRPTPRTKILFGPPGFAYVYFTYGMHWMFNVVCGEENKASAVLVRALEPQEGLDMMRSRRGRSLPELSNGPAKLAQALGIERAHNGLDLCDRKGKIWVECLERPAVGVICRGPRIGLGKTPEPWLSAPWRFWIKDNPFVSATKNCV